MGFQREIQEEYFLVEISRRLTYEISFLSLGILKQRWLSPVSGGVSPGERLTSLSTQDTGSKMGTHGPMLTRQVKKLAHSCIILAEFPS